jgi:hypothetical protein
VTARRGRQFESISSRGEPERFDHRDDGSVAVRVHQVVHDAKTGELLDDTRVEHCYSFQGGLVERMDVRDSERSER